MCKSDAGILLLYLGIGIILILLVDLIEWNIFYHNIQFLGIDDKNIYLQNTDYNATYRTCLSNIGSGIKHIQDVLKMLKKSLKGGKEYKSKYSLS